MRAKAHNPPEGHDTVIANIILDSFSIGHKDMHFYLRMTIYISSDQVSNQVSGVATIAVECQVEMQRVLVYKTDKQDR